MAHNLNTNCMGMYKKPLGLNFKSVDEYLNKMHFTDKSDPQHFICDIEDFNPKDVNNHGLMCDQCVLTFADTGLVLMGLKKFPTKKHKPKNWKDLIRNKVQKDYLGFTASNGYIPVGAIKEIFMVSKFPGRKLHIKTSKYSLILSINAANPRNINYYQFLPYILDGYKKDAFPDISAVYGNYLDLARDPGYIDNPSNVYSFETQNDLPKKTDNMLYVDDLHAIAKGNDFRIPEAVCFFGKNDINIVAITHDYYKHYYLSDDNVPIPGKAVKETLTAVNHQNGGHFLVIKTDSFVISVEIPNYSHDKRFNHQYLAQFLKQSQCKLRSMQECKNYMEKLN